MALRRSVGLGFALATGIALGYSVRPAAQGEPVTFRVEPAGVNLVRVHVSRGGVEFVEDHAIELSVSPDAASVQGSRDMTTKMRGNVIVAIAEKKDALGNVTQSFRVPTK